MESFSTPRRSLVPLFANAGTLAAVVLAVVWSGSQRPEPVRLSGTAEVQANTVPAATSSRNAPRVALADERINDKLMDAGAAGLKAVHYVTPAPQRSTPHP